MNSCNMERLFALLFLGFVCFSFQAAEENKCNFAECITKVKDYLFSMQKPGVRFSCKQLNETVSPWCSDNCIQRYFHLNVSEHSTENSYNFVDYCERRLAHYTRSNWSCITKHSFRLLTCYANASSITTNDVREDMLPKESCRKSLEFDKCPSEILLDECGTQSVKVIQNLFEFAKKYFMIPSCGDEDADEVSVLPVHYHLQNDYMVTAKCFDMNHVAIGNFFTQLIKDETDIHDYICLDDILNEYVQFHFKKYSKDCKNLPAISHMLLPKLLSLGRFKCNSTLKLELLSSSPSQDLRHETSTHEKNPSHFLKDQTDVPSYTETSELTPVSTATDPVHENLGPSQESSSLDRREFFAHVNSGTNDEVSSKHKNKTVINENPSESLQKNLDVNYLKTSGARLVLCDITLFAIVCFVAIASGKVTGFR